MDRRSKHLSSEERGVIFAEHERGSSQRMIGRLLGRAASTICRELGRGRQADASYCPQTAWRVYDTRRARCRRRPRLIEGSTLHRFVHDYLVYRRWSPEQIAQRLRRMKPDDPSARVSHETIHAAIYALRQAKPATNAACCACKSSWPASSCSSLMNWASCRSPRPGPSCCSS